MKYTAMNMFLCDSIEVSWFFFNTNLFHTTPGAKDLLVFVDRLKPINYHYFNLKQQVKTPEPCFLNLICNKTEYIIIH